MGLASAAGPVSVAMNKQVAEPEADLVAALTMAVAFVVVTAFIAYLLVHVVGVGVTDSLI